MKFCVDSGRALIVTWLARDGCKCLDGWHSEWMQTHQRSNNSRPKQMQQKQNPAFSRTPLARFSPMNRPLTPIKPTITIKYVPTVVFKPKRKTILDLSNDPDHPVEWASSTISWLSKKKLKTHNCTICQKTRYDKVHCNWYCYKYCNFIRVRHLPIKYPVFLAASVIPILLTSTHPPRPTPPSFYLSNHTRYLNQIVPGNIPHDAYNDGHFDDDYIENDTYCDDWCPEAKHNMDTWGLNPVASNVEGG